MSAAEASQYQTLAIQSNDGERTVDIRLGTISIDYYEDIFSPTVTAKIKVVNTGDTIGDGLNKQSLYNGLPLRGGERIAMKILDRGQGKTGLDFATDPNDNLYVSSITDVVSETQRESFTLHLVSREAITNETARVVKKYPRSLSISDSVKEILKDTTILKTNKFSDTSIEKSQNEYGFIGNLRKPFTVLVWLASKAVPVSSGDATAGFVFYQTQDGFNFRSIDNLINQQAKATYEYTEINQSSIERNNDFQITTYTTDRNQNLIEKLRLGTYASQRMFFNPLTFNFTTPEQGLFQYGNYGDKVENLGDPIDLPLLSEASEKTLKHAPTRILSSVLDIGTMEKDVSTDENADPSKYQAQAIMRYNVLFTQTVSMTVPCNTNLRAGDTIKCFFPKISRNDGQEFDPDQSGLYMIKELCHHFDKTRSFTSMLLVRDTFGLYTGK
tara:strand:- start:225 stop:1550 length:1326 start_codon:yes stop_codon:yes gene_type:complete